MAVYRITVKQRRMYSGKLVTEPGMSVEVMCLSSAPLLVNGGRDVIEAFYRKYGIDIRSVGGLNTGWLQVEKIG